MRSPSFPKRSSRMCLAKVEFISQESLTTIFSGDQAIGANCPDFTSTARAPGALLPVPPRRRAGPVRWGAGARNEPIAIRRAAHSIAETSQSMSHPGPRPRRESSRESPGTDTRPRSRKRRPRRFTPRRAVSPTYSLARAARPCARRVRPRRARRPRM
jgi:hypothetical protein